MTPLMPVAAGSRALRGMTTAMRNGMGRAASRLRGDSPFVRGVPPHLRGYLREVERLGVRTEPGAANFYSGGNGAARRAAEEHAQRSGTTTLEKTPGGQWLDRQGLFRENSPISGDDAYDVWSRTSTRYAEQASGDVRSFVHDPNPNGVWQKFELPALERGLADGRVSGITVEDLAHGTTDRLRSTNSLRGAR